MVPDAHKVLIYATWRGRLLVFDEPDFPEIEFQVPGGTVEPGEATATAALREFTEETGLKPNRPLCLWLSMSTASIAKTEASGIGVIIIP